MSSKRSMCVWQALHAMDLTIQGDPPKDLVKRFTSNLTGNILSGFYEEDFDDYFEGKTIRFDDYMKYLENITQKLEKSKGNSWENTIEVKCWDICKTTYDFEEFQVEDPGVRMLWDIFNQVCEPGTLPPMLDPEEANWIAEKISSRLGQNWNCTNIPMSLQFTDFVRILHEKSFLKAPASVVLKEISSLHSWMVKEIIYSGWLYKCSFKLGSVHGMDKKWFVLLPGRLIYYASRSMVRKEGEIPIGGQSRLENLPNSRFNMLAQNCQYRFMLIKSNGERVELAAVSKAQKMAWMGALTEVIQAAKTQESPLQLFMKDRKSWKQSIRNAERNSMETAADGAGRQSRKQSLFGAERYKSIREKKESIPQKMPMHLQDEKIIEKIDKIQVIFCNFDKDNNGAIDRLEFKDFVKRMGVKLDDQEIDVLFSKIDDNKNGIITMDEFTHYFMNNVLNVIGENSSKAETDFQAAFLQADRDGTGTIDFKEFTDYICEKNRNMKSSKIMKIFSQLTEKDEELSIAKFKELFSHDDTENSDDQTLDGQLMNMYSDADAGSIANFLVERWSSFASFKRAGASGDLVMTGGNGMVADVLPGPHSLVDLACYTDLPPITPRHAIIENVCWNKSAPHGKVIFPSNFDGLLPVDIATTEHLRYYGASLADSTQVEVSLMCRHGIQDFTYENNYLEDYVEAENGGCGLEMHDFSHLDCPLQDDSGYFIIGKMLDQTLYLTAFKVPTRHTLYLPGGIIHSNDYMKGTWRIMLSDAIAIDHCHIMQQTEENNNGKLVGFEFSFEEYI